MQGERRRRPTATLWWAESSIGNGAMVFALGTASKEGKWFSVWIKAIRPRRTLEIALRKVGGTRGRPGVDCQRRAIRGGCGSLLDRLHEDLKTALSAESRSTRVSIPKAAGKPVHSEYRQSRIASCNTPEDDHRSGFEVHVGMEATASGRGGGCKTALSGSRSAAEGGFSHVGRCH